MGMLLSHYSILTEGISAKGLSEPLLLGWVGVLLPGLMRLTELGHLCLFNIFNVPPTPCCHHCLVILSCTQLAWSLSERTKCARVMAPLPYFSYWWAGEPWWKYTSRNEEKQLGWVIQRLAVGHTWGVDLSRCLKILHLETDQFCGVVLLVTTQHDIKSWSGHTMIQRWKPMECMDEFAITVGWLFIAQIVLWRAMTSQLTESGIML